MDFQKAFDKVPHERLMLQVNAHDIQGDAARWIQNWLAGRPQRVCINQSNRNRGGSTSGVPQISVLGPLLFYININDIDTNIVSKMFKFADDTKLCHRTRNPDNITEPQGDVNKLVERTNKCCKLMSFVDKCSVMHIGHNNLWIATVTRKINSCRQQINNRI